MDNTTPFVSLIIPALNEEKTIGDCLVSLFKMDYPPERWEILVVDNGSTDRTAEIVKSFPVRYLREERRGVPRQVRWSRRDLDGRIWARVWWPV